MNEDAFNASLRGFLKKVGITSQREIEKAVRDAVAAGQRREPGTEHSRCALGARIGRKRRRGRNGEGDGRDQGCRQQHLANANPEMTFCA